MADKIELGFALILSIFAYIFAFPRQRLYLICANVSMVLVPVVAVWIVGVIKRLF